MTREEFEQEFGQKEFEIIIGYLKTASPEQLHVFAATSNYDGNSMVLEWLIENPNMDKATALLIYWYQGAAWFVQFASEAEAEKSASSYLQRYRQFRLIEKRFKEGFYADHGILFDPMQSEGGRPDDYPKLPVKQAIPDYMLQAVGTEHVDLYPEDYDEGLPFEICEQVSNLYDELESKVD